MQAWERFTVQSGSAIGEPGDLPREFGGNATGLSAADLARIGALLAEQGNPLAGQYAGQGFRLVDLPEPDPPRREIPKSTIMARVAAKGKFDAVFAILLGQPIFFGKWFAPDWPNVFFDDADMLMLLGAAGCSDDEIEEITAPIDAA